MVFQMERELFFSPDGEKLEVKFKDGQFWQVWNTKRNLDNIMKYIASQTKKYSQF